MSHLLIAAALRPSASAFRQCVAKAPIGRRALFGRIPDNCARFVGRPQRVGPGIRTMSKKVEEVESASFFRRVWQSINDRVNRIPKVYRVGFRVARVGFLAFTLYNLGKAEGMAEYATNPEAYCQHILVSVISQFTAPGVQPQDVVITGPTEDRVIRILQKVVDGATKTLTRLHDQSTDPDEQERYREAFKMLKRRWNVIVLDCDAMNAFVHPLLPGHIFFLTGLVGPEADFTDEEIAMVCAHELSHALLQHGREALASQGMVVGLKMAVLTALDPSGILSLVVEARCLRDVKFVAVSLFTDGIFCHVLLFKVKCYVDLV